MLIVTMGTLWKQFIYCHNSTKSKLNIIIISRASFLKIKKMDEKFIPDDVLLLAEEASNTLIPEKSRDRYDKELHAFNEWREKQSTSKVLNETVVLAYIAGLAKTFKPSSLWTKFSMLRKSLQICENVDIYKFGKVVAFVKKQNIGYKPKKSKTLNDEQCRKFIMEAPDDQFLLSKVVLIFGLYGACRRDELLKLTVLRRHLF